MVMVPAVVMVIWVQCDGNDAMVMVVVVVLIT